ncbi:MAG TPA: response regulator [Armatimonadota bacterium]
MDISRLILLIEDDIEQAYLFVDELKMHNFTVTAVTTAEEALATLATTSFALALVDLQLPDLSGDALITRMKAHDPGMKTILFSNNTRVQHTAAACGADAAFRKLDSIFELGAIVTRVLNREA